MDKSKVPKNEQWLKERDDQAPATNEDHARATRVRKAPDRLQITAMTAQKPATPPDKVTKTSASPNHKAKQSTVKHTNKITAPETPKKMRYGEVKHDEVNNSYSNHSNGAETPEKGTPKKKHQYYVDAVEKLETSTSVHIPKRLLLFVGNIHEDVTKDLVEEHFRKTGGLKDVKMPKEKGGERHRGYAVVEFRNTISHRLALRLHNTTLGGQKITVDFSSPLKKKEPREDKLIDKPDKLPVLKMPFDT